MASPSAVCNKCRRGHVRAMVSAPLLRAVIVVLAAGLRGAVAPLSPCPAVLQYEQEGQTLQATVNVPGHVGRNDLELFLVAGDEDFNGNFAGKIELLDEEDVLAKLLEGESLWYRLRMPLSLRVATIVFDGKQICPLSSVDVTTSVENSTRLIHSTCVSLQERPCAGFTPQELRSLGDVSTRTKYNQRNGTDSYLVTITDNTININVDQIPIRCGMHVETRAVPMGRTDQGDWPWIVALYRTSRYRFDFQYMHSGILVSDRTVVVGEFSPGLYPGGDGWINSRVLASKSRFFVKAGSHGVHDWSRGVVQIRTVRSIVATEDFQIGTNRQAVVVFKVDRPFTYTHYVIPICLWRGDQDVKGIVGEDATVVAWTKHDRVPLLHTFQVAVVNQNRCLNPAPTSSPIFCAETLDEFYSSQMYDGAGLFVRRGKYWRLRGLLYGSSDVDRKYLVYLDVAKHIEWLQNTAEFKEEYYRGTKTNNFKLVQSYTSKYKHSVYRIGENKMYGFVTIYQNNDTDIENDLKKKNSRFGPNVCGVSSNHLVSLPGERAARGDWPWVVALYENYFGLFTHLSYECPGTLVSYNVIIAGDPDNDIYYNKKQLVARASPHDLNTWSEDSIQLRNVTTTLSGPQGVIALILDRPFQHSEFAVPICLWKSTRMPADRVYVVGWNFVGNSNQLAVSVPTAVKSTSVPKHPSFGEKFEGGYFMRRSDHWELRGIIGSYHNNSKTNYPIYEDIANLTSWIQEVVDDNEVSCELPEYEYDVSYVVLYNSTGNERPGTIVKPFTYIEYSCQNDRPAKSMCQLDGTWSKVTNCFEPEGVSSGVILSGSDIQITTGISTRTSVKCGVPHQVSNPLVVRGSSVTRGDWPWVVALYRYAETGANFTCSGSLVSDKYVVTAAHCVIVMKDGIYQPLPVSSLLIKAGVFDLRDWTDEHTRTLNVFRMQFPPDFENDKFLESDIVLMELGRRVAYSDYIVPICLWTDDTEQRAIFGQTAVVIGWGRNENGDRVTPEPRRADLPIVATETCRKSHVNFKILTNERTLCAGNRDGTGPCNGDSGGGLFMWRNTYWALRGIVSNSIRDSKTNSCDLTKYIIFTDTAKYLDWIKTVIGKKRRD